MFPSPLFAPTLFAPTLFPRPSGSGPVVVPVGLVGAIVAHLEATPALVTAFGQDDASDRFFADSAPAGCPLPYLLALDPAGETPSWESEDEEGAPSSTDEGEVQVSVFAASKAQAIALRRLVEAALDDAPLDPGDGYLMYFRRGHRIGQLDPGGAEGGADAWQEIRMYRSLIARTG